MSDSVEIACVDVEAQISRLESPAEEGLSEAQPNNISARKTRLRRLILVIRSIELFKLGAHYSVNIASSTSASYASTSSSDEMRTQGSGVVAALGVSADSTHEDLLSASPASEINSITEIVKKKDWQALHDFGGVGVIAKALNTDLENGISSPRQICQCKPSQLSKFLPTLFSSFVGACNNYTIFLLSVAAVLSLGFGIKEDGLHMGWLNGGVLIVTILLIVTGTTIRKCWEELSHKKLEKPWHSKDKQILVRVVRGGKEQFVSENDLEVGDIVVLRKADLVPADGLLVSTGEALELDDGLIKSTTIHERNPFLFYGSRVISGKARMLVTSTLMDTVLGEIMSQAMQTSANKECKLESYLHKLNTCVETAGLIISILIIIVLFLRYNAGKLDDERRFRPDSKGEPTPVRTIIYAIKEIITGSMGTTRVLATLNVSLVGIMEGIPFAISIAAIIWSFKTLTHKASERGYLSSIKVPCITIICTDKFGEMTEHEKDIYKFYVGEECVQESSVVASEVLESLCDGIGTLFLVPPNDCASELLPLISWAERKLGMKRESVIDQCKMINHSGNNPFQEPCRVLVGKKGDGGYLHCKGPPQDILCMCSHYYDVNGGVWEIDGTKKSKLEKAIRHTAEEAEVIAYACKPIEDFDEVSFQSNDLIFLAMISMKETKMEDTRDAISTLVKGGIRTILASGEEVSVLETIAKKYGLLTDRPDDLVLAAEKFRALTDEERMDQVEKICVLGNCLPSDKVLLIKCLRERGQAVALLAQRIVDAPALKLADIGVAYGTWSSKVARDCSDISIENDNCFSFLVNLIKSGRCFQENIRKFIQLQLIVAISNSLISFAAIVSCGDAPVTAVQLFWLNLVVGLVGGLALLTGSSTATLMTKMLPVYRSSAQLISKVMWRNIAIQVSYQTTIFLILQHKGQAILGTSGGQVKSIIYNGFFLCQMFNMVIAREPEEKNIFSGLLHNNFWFWVALVLFIICQAVFALAEQVLGSSPRLTLKSWGVCFLIGVVSCLLDWAGKIASNRIARWAADRVEIGN